MVVPKEVSVRSTPEAINFINRVGVPRKGSGRQTRAHTNERLRLHRLRVDRLAKLQDPNAS